MGRNVWRAAFLRVASRALAEDRADVCVDARDGKIHCTPAVPLAAVMLAGMLHAGLEDWLFAPGYYLCVFYWCMAFVFVDQAPSLALADSRRIFFRRTAGILLQTLGDVASSR